MPLLRNENKKRRRNNTITLCHCGLDPQPPEYEAKLETRHTDLPAPRHHGERGQQCGGTQHLDNQLGGHDLLRPCAVLHFRATGAAFLRYSQKKHGICAQLDDRKIGAGNGLVRRALGKKLQ